MDLIGGTGLGVDLIGFVEFYRVSLSFINFCQLLSSFLGSAGCDESAGSHGSAGSDESASSDGSAVSGFPVPGGPLA